MPTVEERIEAQQKKINQEKAKLQKLKNKVSAEQRKKDTRRKIIVGGAVLAEMRSNPNFERAINQLLNSAVKNPRDRQALNLPTG